MLILPSAASYFHVNWLWEFDIRSKQQLQLDKFEDSYNQIAE